MRVMWRKINMYKYSHTKLSWYILSDSNKEDEMAEVLRQEMGLNVKEQFGGHQVY